MHRFAIVWLLFTTVPFLIGSSYAEPRFFYMALVPFSILVWLGMLRLASLWPKLFGREKRLVIIRCTGHFKSLDFNTTDAH